LDLSWAYSDQLGVEVWGINFLKNDLNTYHGGDLPEDISSMEFFANFNSTVSARVEFFEKRNNPLYDGYIGPNFNTPQGIYKVFRLMEINDSINQIMFNSW